MYPVVEFYIVIAIFEQHQPTFKRTAQVIGFTDTRQAAIDLAKAEFPDGAAYVTFKKGEMSAKSTVVDTIYQSEKTHA